MRLKTLFFLLMMLPYCTFSQSNDTTHTNIYIEKHQDQIGIKLAFTNNTNIFKLHTADYDLVLKPNTAIKTKLYFNYRFILFGIGFAPDFIPGNNDDDQKGKSSIFWMGTKINLDHWIQKLDISKTKGFYLDNTSDLTTNNDINSGEYVQFPELENFNITGYTAYKWNKNFSFPAVETQLERQLKSAGTPLLALTYRFYTIDNKIQLTGNLSSQKSNNFESTLQLGYFYTYVMNHKLYFSAGISGGGGLLYTRLTTRYTNEQYYSSTYNPILRSEGMLALGYNSSRFFMGMHAVGSIEKYRQNGDVVSNLEEGLGVQIFAGYRFNAPGWLKRSFRK